MSKLVNDQYKMDLAPLFTHVIDSTQHTHAEIFGKECGEYMDNYFLKVASSNMIGETL